jgi:hypothetical protein
VATEACVLEGALRQRTWLAPAPGIEFAFEHSDCAGQEGKFRLLK